MGIASLDRSPTLGCRTEILIMHPTWGEIDCPHCKEEHEVELGPEILDCTCGTTLVIIFSKPFYALLR